MIVSIDNHEPAQIAERFRRKGVTVVLDNYDVADYFVSDVVGVERKTARDFVHTLIDGGRLFQQCHELRQNFKHPYLVIEGSFDDLIANRRRVHENSLIGAYTSIIAKYGITIIHVSEDRFVDVVFTLFKKLTSTGPDTMDYTPIRKSATSKEGALALLTSLPNIGTRAASALLLEYGSPLAALNNYKNWINVMDENGRKLSISEERLRLIEKYLLLKVEVEEDVTEETI